MEKDWEIITPAPSSDWEVITPPKEHDTLGVIGNYAGRGTQNLLNLPKEGLSGLSRLIAMGAEHPMAAGPGGPQPGTAKALRDVADWIDKKFDVGNTFDMLGVAHTPPPPSELSPTQRILGKGAEVLGGAVPIGAGVAALSKGATLAGQLGQSALMAAGTGVGEEVGGPVGGMLGGLALPLAGPGAAELVRRMGRGGDPAKLMKAIEDAAVAGTTPSLGQGTSSKTKSGMESTTGRFGGIGVMQRFGESQAAGMATKADELAGTLAPKMEDALAGKKVLEGLTGPGGFVQRSGDKATKLYASVDKAVPENTPITMANTLAYLTERTKINPLAPATSSAFNQEAIGRLGPKLDALLSDMTLYKGNLPYSAVKDMRTAVGQKIDDALLSGDLSQKEARALYSSITADIESSLTGPALKSWQRANAFYKARMDHIEGVVAPFANKATPESVMSTLDLNARQGSTMIRGVMSSLKPDERSVVSSMFIRNMGVANPGAQSAEGALFSPNTFLLRWNKIDDGAKRVMFDAVGGRELRNALDAFARTAERIKKGSQVIANPSGTAAAQYNLQQWFGIGGTGGVASLVMGNPSPIIAAAGTAVAMNGMARMMTSPKIVRWLAKSTTTAPGLWAQQGERLAAETNDPDVRTAITSILGTSAPDRGNPSSAPPPR